MKKSELKRLIRETILTESVNFSIDANTKRILIEALNCFISTNKYKKNFSLEEITFVAKTIQKLNP